MYSVFDISEYFLKNVEKVTPKKLQKLCYYAEAWSHALLNRGLINDSHFEAWIHGPVSPELYRKYKQYGWDILPQTESNDVILREEVVDLLNSVIETYGDLSGNELEALTHSETPWIEARTGYDEDESCNVQIKSETMKNYYKSIYIGD